MTMAKRHFTKQQIILLQMRKDGASTDAIAEALGVQPATVRAKESAIRRGISKRAYLVPQGLAFVQQLDLFETCEAGA